MDTFKYCIPQIYATLLYFTNRWSILQLSCVNCTMRDMFRTKGLPLLLYRQKYPWKGTLFPLSVFATMKSSSLTVPTSILHVTKQQTLVEFFNGLMYCPATLSIATDVFRLHVHSSNTRVLDTLHLSLIHI